MAEFCFKRLYCSTETIIGPFLLPSVAIDDIDGNVLKLENIGHFSTLSSETVLKKKK